MPAVQDMRQIHGDSIQIDWVVEKQFASVVARCEGVSKVIQSNLRHWRKAPFSADTKKEWKAFKKDLQAETYDAVIDLQGLAKSAWVSWLAVLNKGAKRYAMAHRTDGSSYEAPTRWVADVAITMDPHVHAVERSRKLCAAALGYDVPAGLKFGLQGVPKKDVLALNTKPLIALVHGTSRADKQWPMDNWVALGSQLQSCGFALVLPHGSEAEQKTSEYLATSLLEQGCEASDVVVWPKLSLDALIDRLASCKAVIGVDSGVSHIAVALNLPHVQIYNFDTAWRTGPLQGKSALSKPLQLSVFASPYPSVHEVFQVWEKLGVESVKA